MTATMTVLTVGLFTDISLILKSELISCHSKVAAMKNEAKFCR